MTMTHDWYHGRIQDLDAEECFELMSSKTVGRIAFCTVDGPVVLPVNFVVHHGTVVFRTAPHNTIARHVRDGRAAFQVDEADDYTESGWSVLLQGTADFVDHEDLPDERPEPWADGVRSLLVRVTPRTTTGRRLFPG